MEEVVTSSCRRGNNGNAEERIISDVRAKSRGDPSPQHHLSITFLSPPFSITKQAITHTHICTYAPHRHKHKRKRKVIVVVW